MTDQARSAQSDLAFMRAVAEDRGPLPPLFGAHLFAVGLIFGLNVIYVWAGLSGFLPLPDEWMVWSWAPGAAVWTPVYIWLMLRTPRNVDQLAGPAARAFAAVWAGVLLATAVIVAVVSIGSAKTGEPFYLVWPAIALALYGAAWAVIGIVRKAWWMLAGAAGSFASAVACALLIDQKEHWLAMGIGLLFFMAVPGWIVMTSKRQT
jgi:hypothetical protein